MASPLWVVCMLCRECVFSIKDCVRWLQLSHLMSTSSVSKQCVMFITFYESNLNSGMVNLAGLHLCWAKLFLCDVTSYQQLKMNYRYMKMFYVVQLVCWFVLWVWLPEFFVWRGTDNLYSAHTCENQMKKKVQSLEIVINFDFLYFWTLTVCKHLFNILLTHKPSGKFYLL
jgi:hypothetical protein